MDDRLHKIARLADLPRSRDDLAERQARRTDDSIMTSDRTADIAQDSTVPVFLTASEAAAFLRLSTVTMSRWRISGQGPLARWFGRRVVYARADLIAWADERRRQSTSAGKEKES